MRKGKISGFSKGKFLLFLLPDREKNTQLVLLGTQFSF